MVVHAFNHSTARETETDRSLSSRPAWSSLVYRMSSRRAKVTQRNLVWKEKTVRQYVVGKSLNKKERSPGPKHPIFRIFSFPTFYNTNTDCCPETNTKENEEKPAEYVKLLDKRMKEAKEKRQA